jgi:hypothetical protein
MAWVRKRFMSFRSMFDQTKQAWPEKGDPIQQQQPRHLALLLMWQPQPDVL